MPDMWNWCKALETAELIKEIFISIKKKRKLY